MRIGILTFHRAHSYGAVLAMLCLTANIGADGA